jgi:hypothetical protein
VPSGGWPLGQVRTHDVAERCCITAMATARVHQDRPPSRRLDSQRQPPLVAVRAVIAARATGHRHDLCCGCCVAVRAASDGDAGALERRAGWRKAQALGGGGGNEAPECRHPRVVARIQGTPARVIVAMAGGNGRGAASSGRLLLQDMRPQGAWVVDAAQAGEDHRLAGRACGHQTPCRVLLRRFLNALGDTACFKHPRDKAQGISEVTLGGLWHALSSQEEILLPPQNDSHFIGGLRNVGIGRCHAPLYRLGRLSRDERTAGQNETRRMSHQAAPDGTKRLTAAATPPSVPQGREDG